MQQRSYVNHHQSLYYQSCDVDSKDEEEYKEGRHTSSKSPLAMWRSFAKDLK